MLISQAIKQDLRFSLALYTILVETDSSDLQLASIIGQSTPPLQGTCLILGFFIYVKYMFYLQLNLAYRVKMVI